MKVRIFSVVTALLLLPLWVAAQEKEGKPKRFPRGMVFAKAMVNPDSAKTFVPSRPGRVLYAKAGVREDVRDVAGGEEFPLVDEGGLVATVYVTEEGDEGMSIEPTTVAGLVGLAGGALLWKAADGGKSGPLPLMNGGSTLYVGSDRSFDQPVIFTDKAEYLPESSLGEFRDAAGRKVGEVVTFSGMDIAEGDRVEIRTLDERGRVIEKERVDDGARDGTLGFSFNRKTYDRGESGFLEISNIRIFLETLRGTTSGLEDLPGELTIVCPSVGTLNRTLRLAGKDRIRLPFVAPAPGEIAAQAFLPGLVSSGEKEREKELRKKLPPWAKSKGGGDAAFDSADENGDGKWDRDEVEKMMKDADVKLPWWRSWSRAARALIDKFDANGDADGKLNREEWKKLLGGFK